MPSPFLSPVRLSTLGLASTLLRRSPGLDHPAADSLTVRCATPLCLKENCPLSLLPVFARLLTSPRERSALVTVAVGSLRRGSSPSYA